MPAIRSSLITNTNGLSFPHSSQQGIPKMDYPMGGGPGYSTGHVKGNKDLMDPLQNFDPSRYMPSQINDPLLNTMRPMHTGNEMVRDQSVELGTLVSLIFDEDYDRVVDYCARTIAVTSNTASWQNIYFPINELDRISELTSGRYDSFTKTYEMASLQSFGKSIRIEHDMWKTPEGRAIFAQLLYNFAISTRITKGKDIISVLLSCKTVPRAPNFIREQFVNKNMKNIMRREIMVWDCLKQDARGMQMMFNIVDQDCKERGIKLDTCLGSTCIRNVLLMHEKNLLYKDAGPPGVAKQSALATDLFQTPYGYDFIPVNQMCRKQSGYDKDILKTYAQRGEFFVSKDLNRGINYNEYNSLNRAISIYDEDEDRMQTILIHSMLLNCNKFDSSGCPQTYHNLPRQNTTVDYTKDQKNSDPFLYAIDPRDNNSLIGKVKYFGQIEERHIQPARILNLAKSAKTAALKNLNSQAEELNDLIYQVRDIIRVANDEALQTPDNGLEEYLQALLNEYTRQKSSFNSANTNPTIGDLKEGITEQGADAPPPPLEVATGYCHNIAFPPCYQNWNGFKAIALAWNKNRESLKQSYPNATENFETVAKFVNLFKRFIRVLNEQWQSCVFLDENLCASYHVNPSSEHTAFENLVVSGQLPAFKFNEGENDGLQASDAKAEILKRIFNLNVSIRNKFDSVANLTETEDNSTYKQTVNELRTSYESVIRSLYQQFGNNWEFLSATTRQGDDEAHLWNSEDSDLYLRQRVMRMGITLENHKRDLEKALTLAIYLNLGAVASRDKVFVEVLQNFTEINVQNILNYITIHGFEGNDFARIVQENTASNCNITLAGRFKNKLRETVDEMLPILQNTSAAAVEPLQNRNGVRLDIVISSQLAKSLLTSPRSNLRLLPADPRCLDRPLYHYDEALFESFEERQKTHICHLAHLPVDPTMMMNSQNNLRKQSAELVQVENEFFENAYPQKRRRIDNDDPNKQLCDVVATLQLDGFRNLWHAVNKTSKDPLSNIMAKVYMGTCLQFDQLISMADNHIVIPFQFTLPRITTYGTLILIFIKSGGGSVIILENPIQRKIEILHDGQNRFSHVSYYSPFKAIVPDANMVYHFQDSFTCSYVGGGGTQFIDPAKYNPRDNEFGYPGSLFCFLSSYEEKINNPLSLTGIVRADDKTTPNDIVDNMNENLSYSTAHYYNTLYQFPTGDRMGDDLDGFDMDDRFEANKACNLCTRGLTLYHNPQSGGFDFMSNSVGHWKDGSTYPGCAPTRAGQCTAYDSEYWTRRQTTNVSELV